MKIRNLILTVVIGSISGISGALFVNKFLNNEKNEKKHQLIEAYRNDENNNFRSKTVANNFDDSILPNFNYSAEIGMAAVVHIKTSYNQQNYTLYDFIFGTSPQSYTPVHSSGSGAIISSDGYIVTNNHVIQNAEIIEIVLSNKESFPATLIGRDATTDIALLKIDKKDLPSFKYGNSDDIRIGDWVLAIGNPFNLTSTATAGIISAKARNINIMKENMAIESFIQTDAAVNPGNSGGALINIKGELIGINTAIASQTGSYVGYSFAIPVNIVRKVVADLVEYGEVQRGYLGIEFNDINADFAKKMNLKSIEGVYVNNVWEDAAGDKAGIKQGDIIVAINDDKINSSSELLEHTSQYRPGDKIKLGLKRNNKIINVNITLENKYGGHNIVKSQSVDVLGARFEIISDYDKNKHKINNGLKVCEVNAGKLAAIGIKKDFIITKINDNVITSVDDLENIIKNSKKLFIEGIYPNGSTAYYSFQL